MSFICHIHNYTEYNQQWNVFSAFNPSKFTHLEQWGADTAAPGNWGFGVLLKGLTSVVDNSCRSRDSNPQPRVTSPTLYPLEPRLPLSCSPCHWHSRCWEWSCGVSGQHTLFLNPLTILNSRPASQQSSPSPPLSPDGPSAHPQPTIRAGGTLVSTSSLWVLDSTSALWTNGFTMAPSSLLSAVAHQSASSAGLPHPSGSTLVSYRPSAASGLHSSGYISSLRLYQGPPSLWFHLGPLSLRLHCGLPEPHLCLSHQSHLLRLGLPDLPHQPGSSSLHLGLLHLLCRRLSCPWSRQPFLHHGSSLRQLHSRSQSLWLRPGSPLAPPAPSPSWLIPPSDPPWHLLSPPWTSWITLLLGVRLLPEPPPVWSACLPVSPLPSPVTIPSPLLVSPS